MLLRRSANSGKSGTELVKYLLDSVILIDILNGMSKAIDWIKGQAKDEMMISVVTRAEVLSKAGNQWEAVLFFLDEFRCLTIGPEEADLAAGLRNQYRLKLPDAFQAALAQSEELVLITRDAHDFEKIEGLQIKIPYRI